MLKSGFSAMSHLRAILPKRLNKGDAGRILVVGGSFEYTGAPFFSAMAAMRAGADLAHIICHHDAATAIKSYSPDLIVHPMFSDTANLDNDKLESLLDRIDIIVVGPGLSRDSVMMAGARQICFMAKEKKIPLIIDGDGIGLALDNSLWKDLETDKWPVVLTPNRREWARLCKNISIEDFDDLESAAGPVSRHYRCQILVKGSRDALISPDGSVTNFESGGYKSEKRVGGQGDILSGIIALFLAWNVKSSIGLNLEECIKAASLFTRIAASCAFEEHGMSMLGSDILKHISQANLDQVLSILQSK